MSPKRTETAAAKSEEGSVLNTVARSVGTALGAIAAKTAGVIASATAPLPKGSKTRSRKARAAKKAARPASRNTKAKKKGSSKTQPKKRVR